MLASSGPTQSSGAHGQKIWAALLVFDAFFVIVFGGALAAKIYQHWQVPPPVVVVPRHIPHQKAAESPAPPPAKPEEPVKAAPASKPAPTAAAAVKSDGLKPPKPSMLHEAPRHEAAKPEGAGNPRAATMSAAQAPAAPPADGKVKAVPVDFRLKAPNADSVELAGPFIVRGGKKPMKGHDDGTWTITLYLTPNTYRYHFIVDGKKTLDPENPKTDRGASVLNVP